jgi:hypothetical protein
MEVEIKLEQLKNERDEYVNRIISDSLNLCVAESKAYTLKNINSLQNVVSTRFSRIKNNYGKVFSAIFNGNQITVTRYEDEVVR